MQFEKLVVWPFLVKIWPYFIRNVALSMPGSLATLPVNIKMGKERIRVNRKGPKFNCSLMFSYFLKASHLSSFVFKSDSSNR